MRVEGVGLPVSRRSGGGVAGQLGEAALLEGKLRGLALAEGLAVQRLGPRQPGRDAVRVGGGAA